MIKLSLSPASAASNGIPFLYFSISVILIVVIVFYMGSSKTPQTVWREYVRLMWEGGQSQIVVSKIEELVLTDENAKWAFDSACADGAGNNKMLLYQLWGCLYYGGQPSSRTIIFVDSPTCFSVGIRKPSHVASRP